MQILGSFTGVTERKGVNIQKGIGQLILVKTGPSVIADEIITLGLVTDRGRTSPIMAGIKVRKPAVISQFGTGYQLQSKTGAGAYKCSFALNLTFTPAAITLENNDYLVLDLTGLSADCTYSVYGAESSVSARNYVEYSSFTLQGAVDSQTKVYKPEVGGYKLALANNGALATLRIAYANGAEIEYTTEELNTFMRLGNDIAFAPDTLSTDPDLTIEAISGGGTELLFISLKDVVKFTIVTVPNAADLSIVQLIAHKF